MRRYIALMCTGLGLALWLDSVYALLWSAAHVLAIYRLDLALGAVFVSAGYFIAGTVVLVIAMRLYWKKP